MDNTIPQVHQLCIVQSFARDLIIDKSAHLVGGFIKRGLLGQIVLDNWIVETIVIWSEPSSNLCDFVDFGGFVLIAGNDLLYLLILIL
jgi:hypothetical protein